MLEPTRAALTSVTMTSRIRIFTTAPRGEQDGATLDDGTLVHWPPHLGERIAAIVKTGDRVRVAGRMESGPAGDRHFEASQIRNVETGDTLDVAISPPPPGPPRPPRGARGGIGEQTTRGVVREFTQAPRGEIDGVVLDNGTVVHWPPHRQDEFRSIVKKGDRVLAFGRTETAPRGETQFETTGLKNLDTGVVRGDVSTAHVDRSAGPINEGPDARLRAIEERLERIERLIQDQNRNR